MAVLLALSCRWQAEQRPNSITPKLTPTNGYLVTADLRREVTGVVVRLSADMNEQQTTSLAGKSHLPYHTIPCLGLVFLMCNTGRTDQQNLSKRQITPIDMRASKFNHQ